MAKHTQAHLTRSVQKNSSEAWKEMTRRKMEYYMGAKLIEIGVEPKSAIYRWSSEIQGSNEAITYSAYWGDSKAKVLEQEADQTPS